MKVTFSINLYDNEGDSFNDCLLLHFGDNFILKLKDVKELDGLILKLKEISEEAKESL